MPASRPLRARPPVSRRSATAGRRRQRIAGEGREVAGPAAEDVLDAGVEVRVAPVEDLLEELGKAGRLLRGQPGGDERRDVLEREQAGPGELVHPARVHRVEEA